MAGIVVRGLVLRYRRFFKPRRSQDLFAPLLLISPSTHMKPWRRLGGYTAGRFQRLNVPRGRARKCLSASDEKAGAGVELGADFPTGTSDRTRRGTRSRRNARGY